MPRQKRSASLPDHPANLKYEHIEYADSSILTPAERAALFMKYEGPNLHPAFDICDKDEDKKSQQSALKGAEFTLNTRWHTEKFLETMKTYQDAMPDPAVRAIDIRAQHSWEDVLTLARNAKEEYDQKQDKALRKKSRAFSDIAEAGLPWFRLIPQEFYLEVLAGGLRLVFEAAVRFGQIRGRVIYALAQIPMLLHETEDCTATFCDVDLYARAENLYVAALAAIEGATKWLNEGRWTKHLKALAHGPIYGKSLKDKVDALDQAMKLLRERATALTNESIGRIEKTVKSVDKVVRNTDQTVQDTGKTVKNTERNVKDSIDTMRDTDQKVNCMRNALDEMVKVLADRNLTSEWMNNKEKEIRKLQSRIKKLERTAAALTPQELLELLEVGPDIPDLDLDYVLRRECTAMEEASSAALATINCPAFINWQANGASAALYVQGSTSASSRRITPTSIISSRTIESLKDLRNDAVPIYFFCNAHTSDSDPLKGPQGLVRSLLVQLVQAFKFDLSFISLQRAREQLQVGQLRFLCETFTGLVYQIPADATLFCIIDGIRDFESKRWRDDCIKTVTMLRDLVDDDRVEATFKLLVTSSTRTKFVFSGFAQGERLSLQEIDDGRRVMISTRETMTATRRPKRLKDDPVYMSLRRQQDFRLVGDFEMPDLSTDSEWSES